MFGGGNSDNEFAGISNKINDDKMSDDETDIYSDQTDDYINESNELILRKFNKVFKTCKFFPPDTKVLKYLKIIDNMRISFRMQS